METDPSGLLATSGGMGGGAGGGGLPLSPLDIGPEHLLLGLIREYEGVAGQVLARLGVDLGGVRAAVVARLGQADRQPAGGLLQWYHATGG